MGALALTLNPATAYLDGSNIAGLQTNNLYTQYGELKEQHGYKNATGLLSIVYGRDALGRIAFKTETVGGVTTGYEYFYDVNGRLTDALQGPDDCDVVTCSPWMSWAYDVNGNRTSETVHMGPNIGTVSSVFDEQDRLTSAGSGATLVNYSWNNSGQMQGKVDASGTTNMHYDALGKLREVQLPASQGGDLIEYMYGPFGTRTGRMVNGVVTARYLWNGQQLVAELAADGTTLVTRYVYAEAAYVPSYMEKGGNTYRLLHDHLGSVRVVADVATGTVAQRIDYDPWGRVTQDTNPGFQVFGYAGGVWDAATGLVHFRARDYDPRSGRWTAKDPSLFTGGINLYRYASNDPINYIDPSGNIPVVPVIIGAAVVLGMGATIHGGDVFVDKVDPLGAGLATAAAGMLALEASVALAPYVAEVLAAGTAAGGSASQRAGGCSGGASRALNLADLGMRGTASELQGTVSTYGNTRVIRLDMIKGPFSFSQVRHAIPTMLNNARAEGITTLQVEASVVRDSLLRFIQNQAPRHGGVISSNGGVETITFTLR